LPSFSFLFFFARKSTLEFKVSENREWKREGKVSSVKAQAFVSMATHRTGKSEASFKQDIHINKQINTL
jgi:hypothetical protein